MRVVDRIERIARRFDGYSDHQDAPRALDRPEEDGLTTGSTNGGTGSTNGGTGSIDPETEPSDE